MSGHIVIVEPVPTQRILLRALLEKARYRVDLFETSHAAVAALAGGLCPDMVLVRGAGDGGMALRDVVLHYRGQSALPSVTYLEPAAQSGESMPLAWVARPMEKSARGPFTDKSIFGAPPVSPPVIVALQDGNPAVAARARVRALRAGAADVIGRPFSEPTFLARIRSLLRARAHHDEMRPRGPLDMIEGFAEPVEVFDRPQRIVVMTPRAAALAAQGHSGEGLSAGLSAALAGLVARHPSRFEIVLPGSEIDDESNPADRSRDGADDHGSDSPDAFCAPDDGHAPDQDQSETSATDSERTVERRASRSIDLGADAMEAAMLAALDEANSPDTAGASTPRANTALPDIVILDAAAGAPDGMLPGHIFRLLAELRGRPATRFAAQLLILPPDTADLAAMALDLGVDDLVTEDVSRAELSHRVETLLRNKRLADKMRQSVRKGLEAALIDPLTGLHNRRFALPHLAMMAEVAQVSGRSFAIMMLDIDFFKSINDTYGHATGDTVLCAVARRLRAEVRSRDLVARIGGEEFLVALPDTSEEEARAMAERLRLAIAARPFDGNPPNCALPLAVRSRISVTLSVGVAIGGPSGRPDSGVTELFDRADTALYAAKEAGRNTVTLSASAA